MIGVSLVTLLRNQKVVFTIWPNFMSALWRVYGKQEESSVALNVLASKITSTKIVDKGLVFKLNKNM